MFYNMLGADAVTSTMVGDEGADETVWKIIGTNGNVKRGKLADSDLNHKFVLYQDGKLIVPQASENDGSVKLQENTRVTAYNNFTLCVMIEVLVEYSATYKQGYRFAYCSPGNFQWNEGDDVNKFSTDVQFLCDARMIDRWFIDGVSSGEESFAFTIKDNPTKLITRGTFNKSNVPSTIKGNYARCYYTAEGIPAGYFVIKKLSNGDWSPVIMSLNEDGNMNVPIAKEKPIVLPEIQSITIEPTNINLKTGGNFKVKATLSADFPEGASATLVLNPNDGLTFTSFGKSSSNAKVLETSDITLAANGSASENKVINATVKLTANKNTKQKQVNITLKPDANAEVATVEAMALVSVDESQGMTFFSVQEEIDPSEYDVFKTYCLPIYNFDFDKTDFSEYNVGTGTVTSLLYKSRKRR